MITIGIDPGLTVTGYGIVSKTENGLKAIGWGNIQPPPDLSFPLRLRYINDNISDIICKYKPDAAAVEDIFYAKNVKSALKLGHARGAAILAAAGQDIVVEEYSPLEVKQSVVGYGRADKMQVKTMVSHLLNISKSIGSFDIYDALAIAVCHIHSSAVKNLYDRTY